MYRVECPDESDLADKNFVKYYPKWCGKTYEDFKNKKVLLVSLVEGRNVNWIRMYKNRTHVIVIIQLNGASSP